MPEHSVSDSFIVRIYRFDPEDQRKLAGQVEAMDGTGERVPFTNVDALAAALRRGVAERTRWTKQHDPIRRSKNGSHGPKEVS